MKSFHLRFQPNLDASFLDRLETYDMDSTHPVRTGMEERKRVLFDECRLFNIEKYFWFSYHSQYVRGGFMNVSICCLFRNKYNQYIFTHLDDSYMYSPSWLGRECVSFSSLRDAVVFLRHDCPNIHRLFMNETIPLRLPRWSPLTHQDICDNVSDDVSSYKVYFYYRNLNKVIRDVFVVWQNDKASLNVVPLELLFEIINEFVQGLTTDTDDYFDRLND